MTVKEAIEKYIEKFGSFPYFLTMSMPETDLVSLIEKSLTSGKEIEPQKNLVY